jgi:alkanesulfonate monooxygenase
MPIRFSVDASGFDLINATRRHGRLDRTALGDLASAAEAAGIDRLVLADPDGGQDLATLAAWIVHSTSSLGVEIEHRAGSIEPEIAARQIATLDQLSGGRLTVRVTPPTGEGLSHEESFARLDENLVLLKRLWSNDRPFDHEGPHYSVAGGFVEKKGPQGADMPIQLGGVSGVALDVAGRHATVFELTPGTPEEIRDLIQRVEAAATRYGRSGKIRFALPVLLTPAGQAGHTSHSGAIGVSGPPARVAQTLLGYAALGISEFMVSGLDDEDAIAAFTRDVAPVFQRMVPLQTARRDAGFPRAVRSGPWAS